MTEQTTEGGVRRVINQPPPEGIAVTWVIEPGLRIGALEGAGPDVFGQIKGIGVDSKDRITVLDAQAQELRIVATDGRHLRTLGGKGGGPGELADANGFVIGSDDVIRVNDPRNSRMALFHPDGGFLRSYPLEVQARYIPQCDDRALLAASAHCAGRTARNLEPSSTLE